MSTDIQELRNLIEREKASEERVRKAKEDAETIVKKARERAGIIIQETESDPRWHELKQEAAVQLARKSAEIEEQHKRQVTALEEAAQKNLERAVRMVVEETLKVKP